MSGVKSPSRRLLGIAFDIADLLLIKAWSELDAALALGPRSWALPKYHARVMLLTGQLAGDDPNQQQRVAPGGPF